MLQVHATARANYMYNTCFHGKCFRAAKAMVTAGLRWAPDMWPVEKMIIMTIRPVATATTVRVVGSLVFGFIMAMAAAKNMRSRVPMNSAPT